MEKTSQDKKAPSIFNNTKTFETNKTKNDTPVIRVIIIVNEWAL